MFKPINHIDDIAPFVEHKKEIRFFKHPNGVTIGCYQFMDSQTFDTPEALECRGIAFDERGFIISRPLHKFFNVGEKSSTMLSSIQQRKIVAVYEKVDGSMIATCKMPHGFALRSKQSFNSNVALWSTDFVHSIDNEHFEKFCQEVVRKNWTAIFEFMHPNQRIVVAAKEPSLQLLHVRDNETGQYLMLDHNHDIHNLIEDLSIPQAKTYPLSLKDACQSLEKMENMEGYVYQFDNGDMVKMKCDWYNRFHGVITFMRERDIAEAALHEKLDDIKNALRELGVDVAKVESIEARLKNDLIQISDELESIHEQDKSLSRKDFAIKHNKHPMFGLLMARFSGKDISLKDWYEKNKLKETFSLNVIDNIGTEESWESAKKIKM